VLRQLEKKLKKFGIKRRSYSDAFLCKEKKYLVNSNYFNKWSFKMAYILGYTMADGSLSKNKNNYTLVYKCKADDIEIINFIKNELCPTKPIYLRSIKYKYKGAEKQNKQVGINIRATEFHETLSKYGIIPNKTGKEWLCDIPIKYKYSYLLGLFDGDGTCGIYSTKKQTRATFSICSGSELFLQNIMKNLGNSFGNVYKLGKTNCYQWMITNQNQILFLCENLYKHNEFSLTRKKDKMNEIRQRISKSMYNIN